MKTLRLSALPALLLCLAMLCACGGNTPSASPSPSPAVSPSAEPAPTPSEEPTPSPVETLLPLESPLMLSFSSGAGAWATSLTLEPDGTFTGDYSDMDMGTSGEDYPNGTRYLCRFSGRFTDIRQLDEHSYALTLSQLTSDYEEGKSWIEDGVRHVSSVPYGIEEGTEFIFYLPDTPTEGLSEELLSWWPGRYSEQPAKTLELSGLYNVKMGYGFFG